MIRHIRQYLVIALCAVIVACSSISPLKVYASSETVNRIVIDVALTNTGIVANYEINERINQKITAIMGDAIIEFNNWCIANSIDNVDVYAFYDFIKSTDIGDAVGGLLREDLISPEYIVECVNKYRNEIQYHVDLAKLFTGKEVSEKDNVELSDNAVDYIRSVFDDYAKTESPYVYVNTMSPEDISPLWFTDINQYNILKDYVSASEYYMYLGGYQDNGTKYLSTGTDNTFKIQSIYLYRIKDDFGIYRNQDELGSSTHTIDASIVNTQWLPCTADFFSSAIGNISNVNNSGYWNENHALSTIYCDFDKNVQQRAFMWLVTNDGRYVRVFKTLDDYKFFTVGKEPYYVTEKSADYITTNNSVTVGGNYITGSNYQYSHDVVQNHIDNSDNVDNSVVNNIVNNTTTNIINSYNDSLVGGGGDNDDDGGGGFGGLLDGIGGLVSGITDFLGFIFGLLGDAISLITSLFNTIFEGLKALGSIFTGFTGLLGDLFGFIPSDLINFLVLSIEAAVAIAIWKQFKK